MLHDQNSRTWLELMATLMSDDVYRLNGIASRLAGLVDQLDEFSFPLVATPLAGLLIRPENHVASKRLEALIHLAAWRCRGSRTPTAVELREWLNVSILQDPLAQREDPVEDVFISNLVTWFGNARLFAGTWPDNDYHVQTCLAALSDLLPRPWASGARRHVIAVLRLSEATADRVGIARNTLAESQRLQPIEITTAVLESASANVIFTDAELSALGIAPTDLDPFLFTSERADALGNEALGHTSLERHPLLQFGNHTVVALPTAIGAAVRRYLLDEALAANDLDSFHSKIIDDQVGNVHSVGARAWGVSPVGAMSIVDPIDTREFVGTFDDGGDVHVVYVPDDLRDTASHGLCNTRVLDARAAERIVRVASARTDHPGHRRGLTLLIFGGIGRPFKAELRDVPPDWHVLALPISDFMQLSWDHELSARRAWTFLAQEDELARRGLSLVNLSGFINYYGFLRDNDFTIISSDISLSTTRAYLPTDSVAPLRHDLRTALDRHAARYSDGTSWVEVQRRTVRPTFGTAADDPVFVSPAHAIARQLLGCVEGARGTWWVGYDAREMDPRHIQLASMIWEMTMNWLGPVVRVLEERSEQPPRRPAVFRLRFPDIADLSALSTEPDDTSEGLRINVDQQHIELSCSAAYLRLFLSKRNIGDKQMVGALLRSAFFWCDTPTPSQGELESLVDNILGSQYARFVHITEATSPAEIIYGAVSLPEPSFELPEDRAWSRLDLATAAGWTKPPGPVPISAAPTLWRSAVEVLWHRIRARLLKLERRSVIEAAVLNVASIQKDRMDWRVSAAAMQAMHDNLGDVVQEANMREAVRVVSALASRVIAEMALCTSPVDGGDSCGPLRLGIADCGRGTLLGCAAQSDALHYDLTQSGPVVHKNGSFGVDPSIGEMIGPFWAAHSTRLFREAADQYDLDHMEASLGPEDIAPFDRAFQAEFGISMAQYGDFLEQFTHELVTQGNAHSWVPRRDVLDRLREVGAARPEHALAALSLGPRSRWDEQHPSGAERRDWYPWRYGRRLSLLRRPLVSLTEAPDSEVLIMPTLLDTALQYLFEARSGRLPQRLFDSDEMQYWIGEAANRNGHAFNSQVATKLAQLRWKVRVELSLTELGGGSALGDIDVLAWRPEGSVYVIECKRLMLDRTVGEIGERLRQYVTIAESGRRTEIQKHLDRLAYLTANLDEVSRVTNISREKVELRSALVTDYLTPMQFSERATAILDLVVDYEQLDEAFP